MSEEPERGSCYLRRREGSREGDSRRGPRSESHPTCFLNTRGQRSRVNRPSLLVRCFLGRVPWCRRLVTLPLYERFPPVHVYVVMGLFSPLVPSKRDLCFPFPPPVTRHVCVFTFGTALKDIRILLWAWEGHLRIVGGSVHTLRDPLLTPRLILPGWWPDPPPLLL